MVMTLQEYEMAIEYRAGAKMQRVYALSGSPVQVNVVTLGVADCFLTLQLKDEKARRVVNQLRAGVADKDIEANYKLKNGRLYRRTTGELRLYVPAMTQV